MTPRLAFTSLVGSVVLALAGGCSSAPGDARPGPSTATVPPTSTSEYLPGLAADVYLPTPGDDPVPIVLLVPGGGWQTADRTGLAPLASSLADAGFVAVNATYRAGVDGATFPEPVQDVLCAAGFAVGQARTAGLEPGPVVVLGDDVHGHGPVEDEVVRTPEAAGTGFGQQVVEAVALGEHVTGLHRHRHHSPHLPHASHC